MANKGALIALSGPSGSGKGTIIKQLLEMRSDTVLSISATTRLPRPGEVDGVHYYFIDKQEFEKRIAADEFLEYAEYSGHYYGTPKAPLENWLNSGKNVLLEIEVQGAEKVMDTGVDLVSIFITTPSLPELERRLRGRNTETEENILTRLKVAHWELTRAFRYDYVVINDHVASAVERINTIIEAETMRFKRMENVILEVLQHAETNRY